MQVLLAAHSGRDFSNIVFSHESGPFPPSLTRNSKMYHGIKSDILDCIVPVLDPAQEKSRTSNLVFDGTILVQMLKSGNSVTFLSIVSAYSCFIFSNG